MIVGKASATPLAALQPRLIRIAAGDASSSKGYYFTTVLLARPGYYDTPAEAEDGSAGTRRPSLRNTATATPSKVVNIHRLLDHLLLANPINKRCS
ncbi:hypothetical protein ACFWWC_20245 [Streptomyces sp. NPDC058642]|uniref:hypothetical protein n=1 Tax=Streptomyces sp. NPDC058642 TaxID=3346572 RepID=UPI003652E2F1